MKSESFQPSFFEVSTQKSDSLERVRDILKKEWVEFKLKQHVAVKRDIET